MITKKSLTLTVFLVFCAAVAFASLPGTNTTEHTFCVNSKTKVVTYAKSGKCPKGNDPIQVGSVGPQGIPGAVGPSGPIGATGPQGEPAKTSFNLLLRDGSGKLVEDLVGDGSVYKDGRYWNLNYENGKFTPLISYFYTGFFDSTCKTEPVAILFAKVPSSAEKELEQLKSSSIYNVFVHSLSGVPNLETFYEILPNAKFIDNRDTSAGTEFHQITLKRPVYSVFDQFDTCTLNGEAFFYIDGVVQKSLLLPEPLPAPIKWSRS
ncbi:MAG: collagen-like protein [Candidatus Nanopelagicaceae bacterium]|nr:collagen-like protein [Candidatus Nanopelagicaceae bacterium]